MKNTKKAVALALALTVGSQAGMSFADEVKDASLIEKEIVTQEVEESQVEKEVQEQGEQVVESQVVEKEIVEESQVKGEQQESQIKGEQEEKVQDTTAPSAKGSLEVKVDGNNLAITQKGIYDLESGLNPNSVKANVYEEGNSNNSKTVNLKGNDFSDFTGTIKTSEMKGNVVVDVYAQDLAGNESKVGSKVVSVGNVNEVVEEVVVATDKNPSKCTVGEEKSVERASDYEFLGSSYESNEVHQSGNSVVVSPNQIVKCQLSFSDTSNNLGELDFIINTDSTNPNSGLLVRGVASADGSLSTTSLSGISVEGVEFNNWGYDITDIYLNIKFNGCPHGSSYRMWVKDSSGTYKLVEETFVMYSKAPVAKSDLSALISNNGVLSIRQSGLVDEDSRVDDNLVKAHLKDGQGNLITTIQLDAKYPDGSYVTDTFENSLDLKALGYGRGRFLVEVEAQDKLGNKTIVSSKEIQFNMEIESEEFLSATGFTAEENGIKWLVNGSELKLNALSKSKDDAYNNVYFKVYDGETNNENKILAIVGLNSAGQLECTNVGESYFDLVSSKYSTSASDDSNYTYDNKGEVVLKLKDGAYNKTLSVEAYFTTDDGRESRIPNMFGQLKTDYVAPKATITSESNHFVIRAKDDESGIKSMVVYDANGLVITDSATDGMISVSEDLNPSTVTITDIAGNVSVYDVKNGGIVDGAGTPEVTPPTDDDYVDGDDNGSDGDNGNGGVDNKPEQKPDVPNVPSTPDQTPDVPSTPDNGGNNGEQNPSTPDDKPSVPVNPSEPEEGNKPSNPDNGEINKPVDTDKPNGDGDNKPNDEIIVTPDNGSEDDSSNETTSNPSTSVDVPRLPQTGDPVSLFAGALGVITSGLGFVLTRRKK
ncbi:LPXTG cell wall anchor domain-containing protein [uncultured Clostridium sp.]|uniref:LPXTG cell wall anchor domain-containing protein n=2 Tax=uncultured Clostridium sp. TaxID=59620 RepID=UPI0026358BC9|nr:LPXTG cell wall anchor domain-containing protein [uncultured Clostridium sp.]